MPLSPGSRAYPEGIAAGMILIMVMLAGVAKARPGSGLRKGL